MERFWNKVDKTETCWVWIARRNSCGYGTIRAFGKSSMLAHRVSYILTYDSIPDGLQVLHKCNNPACVRPDHLYAGTVSQNRQDKIISNRQSRLPRTQNPNCKLDEFQVSEVKRLLDIGITHQEIIRILGLKVKRAAISKIKTNRRWND